ncbi:MAG: hypothetical protein ABIF01_01475 [Candidatus Micrarchaeota archaeon]
MATKEWVGGKSRFGGGVERLPFQSRVEILLQYERRESNAMDVRGNHIIANGKREGAEEHYREIVRKANGAYYETPKVQEAVVRNLERVSAIFPEAIDKLGEVLRVAEQHGQKRLVRLASEALGRLGSLPAAPIGKPPA